MIQMLQPEIKSLINQSNFFHLADEITLLVDDGNIFKLYTFIYNSQELARLNEALKFGHTSLRNHLLLMVNMTVRDYLDRRLDAFVRLYGKDRTEFNSDTIQFGFTFQILFEFAKRMNYRIGLVDMENIVILKLDQYQNNA